MSPTRGSSIEAQAEFFNQLPVGMARVSVDGQFELVNEAMARMLGYTRAELLEVDSRTVTHPFDIEENKVYCRKVLENYPGGLGDGIEKRHVCKDGSTLYARMALTPIFEPGGEHSSWLLQLTDIEEAWRAKRVQEAHRSVLDLLTAGAGLEDILVSVIQRAEESDPGMRAVVMLLDARGEAFERVFAPSMPPLFEESLVGFEVGMGRASCGTAVTCNKQVVVCDITTHPDWKDLQALAAAIEARSCISQPIADSRGEVLGVITLVGRGTRVPSVHDLSYMSGIGQVAGLAIERYRVLEELRVSHARFQTMIDCAPEVVLVIDIRAGRFIEANDRVREMYGCSPEQFLAAEPWSFAPECQPDGRSSQAVLMEYLTASALGPEQIFNFTVRTLDGRTKQCEIRLVHLPSQRRNLVRASVIDVSEHRRAEHALRDSEEQLRTTLNSIGDALIATDTEGRITQFNPVAEAITGVRRGEALGKHVPDVVQLRSVEVGEPIASDLHDILLKDSGSILECHALLLSRDGSERYVSKRGTKIHGDQGDAKGMVLVFSDITEWREAQERALQSRKLEAIGQLAGGIAHDFNNLLTSIMGNAELLAQHSDPNVREAARMISVAAGRSADVTGQLLRFSRNEPTVFDPIDLHKLLHETRQLMEHSIDERVVIRLDLEAANPVVYGDASHLQNVFMNLALNARDAIYSKGLGPGKGELRIETFNVLAPKRAVAIRFSDNGIGIEPELQDRIFDPFFTTKSVGSGTGLGLAGLYGTVKSLDGNISMDSIPGQGASFCITLPSVGARVAPDAPVEQSASPPGIGRVLVVDDEQLVRNFSLRALKSFGYEVVGAEDGIQAEELYREQPFDLVLLDMVMPKRGGLDTHRALVAIDPDVKVIVVSGYSRNHTVEEILAAGANDFLQKPFKLGELAAKVTLAMGKPGSRKQS